MKKEDFTIGQSFWLTGNEWRCTDVGTRIITAIKLGPIEVTTIKMNSDGIKETFNSITDDTSWFNGPPYAVCECVLDEYDQKLCHPSFEKWKEANSY